MTTELEKKFFKTFEINKIEYTQCNFISRENIYNNCKNCPFLNVCKIDYPPITDEHYLELICILSKRDYDYNLGNLCSVEELKNYLLGDCIEYVSDIKHQVQELFKGE